MRMADKKTVFHTKDGLITYSCSPQLLAKTSGIPSLSLAGTSSDSHTGSCSGSGYTVKLLTNTVAGPRRIMTDFLIKLLRAPIRNIKL